MLFGKQLSNFRTRPTGYKHCWKWSTVTSTEIKNLTQQSFQLFSVAMFEANDPLFI